MSLIWVIVFTCTSVINGTIRLISDSIYLTPQIPVMLMYRAYLRDQI